MDTLTTPTNPLAIPQYLVYEEINGKPIYYKGYEAVLAQQKKLDDIMGCGTLQFLLISTLLKWLYQTLPDKTYRIATNEAGLHLSKGNNIAGDILIFDWLALSKIDHNTTEYTQLMPRVMIEVDTKAAVADFFTEPNYYLKKTNLLLRAGVEQVIWILSDSQMILVATPNEDWKLVSWKRSVKLIDTYSFCLNELITNDELNIELSED